MPNHLLLRALSGTPDSTPFATCAMHVVSCVGCAALLHDCKTRQKGARIKGVPGGRGSLRQRLAQSADGGGRHSRHARAKLETGNRGTGHDGQHGEHAAARGRGASAVPRWSRRLDRGRCKTKTSGWSCQGSRGCVG